MPKQLLIDSAAQLREVADKLESYANEMGDEAEGEDVPVAEGGDKMKMAAAAIRRGLAKE